MTVQPTSPFAGPYLTDGVTTEWDFGFKITSAAHMVLRVTDLDGSNAEDVTTGFYVAPSFLGQDTGGTVVYPYPAVALAAGKIIIPYRLIPYSQTTRIGNQGGFQPETHERAFDNLAMQVQQVARDVDRAAKVELGETAFRIVGGFADGQTLMKQGDELVGGPDVVALTAAAVVEATAEAEAAAGSASGSASAAAASASSASGSAAAASASKDLSQAAVEDVARIIAGLNIEGEELVNVLASLRLPSRAFETVSDLLGSASFSVQVGDVISAGGYFYTTASALATDHHVTTAGGNKLYVTPSPDTGRYPAEAFGMSQTNTMAQNRVILRKALDAGAVSVGDGEWPLEYFAFKTVDDLWGSGPNCTFVSTNKIIMTTGSLQGNSLNPAVATDVYDIDDVAEMDTTISLTTPADGADFAGGDLVFIYSDNGYTSLAGDFRPGLQLITKVTSVTSGTLGLADPIPAPMPSGANMKVVRGADIVNSEMDGAGVPHYGMTEALHVGNFSVDLPDHTDSWHRFGGTYKSVIAPIWVKNSRRAWSANGIASSVVGIREATISRQIYEAVLGCMGSDITIGPWRTDITKDNEGDNLIALSEGAAGNKIKIASGTDGRDQQRDAVMNIADGASNTVIECGTFKVKNAASVIKTYPRDAPAMRRDTVKVLSGVFDVEICNRAIYLDAEIAGTSSPVYIGPAVRIRAPASAVAQLEAKASDWKVHCEIDAVGGVAYNAAAKNGELGVSFITKPTSITQGVQVDSRRARMPRGLGFMDAQVGVGAAIATTSFTSRYARTIPMGTVQEDDSLEFVIAGTITGTTDTKTVRVRLNTSTVANISFVAATTGAFFVTGSVQFLAASNQRIFMLGGENGGTLKVARQTIAINDATTDILVEIGALVANAADGISLEHVSVQARRENK